MILHDFGPDELCMARKRSRWDPIRAAGLRDAAVDDAAALVAKGCSHRRKPLERGFSRGLTSREAAT